MKALNDNHLGNTHLTSAAGQIFFTEDDLAKRWHVSVKTLQADRFKGGTVPYCKIGRSVRYRLADILAYEERQVRRSTSDTGHHRNASIKEVRS